MSNQDADSQNKLEAAEIKQLIKRRGLVKGKITLFKKYLGTLKLPLEAEASIELEMRAQKLEVVFSEYEAIQDRIETLSTDTDVQLAEREQIQNHFYDCVSKAKSYFNRPIEPNISDLSLSDNRAPEVSEAIKYPDISLPTFSGNITQWLEFRDTFDALINQTNLKPIQKLKYLRSCLKDGALNVISSLEFSDESYAVSWQLLCERYNSPKRLVSNHLKALFNISSVQPTAHSLRELADNITKHLRVLQNLEISTESWDILVIFFLQSKLEKSLSNKWEEKTNTNKLPTLQEFKAFLRAQADLMEHQEANRNDDLTRGYNKKTMVTVFKSSSNFNPQNHKVQQTKCSYCDQFHYINQCPAFLALNPRSRIHAVRRLQICSNCLSPNHSILNCRASRCRTCKGKHNTLLHISPKQADSSPPPMTTLNTYPQFETEGKNQSVNLHSNSIVQTNNNIPISSKPVILSTARVKVTGSDNKTHTLRALLDSGSQSNFISKSAFKRLKLPEYQTNIDVVSFNDNLTNINKYTNIIIQSQNDNFTLNVSCFVVETICNLNSFSLNIQHLKIPSTFELADITFYEGGEIDIILGAEVFFNILCNGQHRLGPGQPILQNTKFGFVVAGPISVPSYNNKKTYCNLVQTNALKSFWSGEEINNKKIPHDELLECENIFRTHTRSSDGNFIVNIPLKSSPDTLGQSLPVVYKRFKSLESKFAKDVDYKTKYCDFMKDFKNSGHMIERKNTSEPCNYLPHHGVLNPQKTTTPLRVVVDASFNTSSKVSLNDLQYTGILFQDSLFNILLRFRRNKFVVNADIEKMYRMIFINPNQYHLQNILWRENPRQPITTYTLTTLSFGLKSAPYLATRCLYELARQYQDQFPEAAQVICSYFYMDDLLFSGDNEQAVIETIKQVDTILKSANFKLRKWKSNSNTITNAVSTKTETQTHSQNYTHKILGLTWSSTSDTYSYSIKIRPIPEKLTKRIILSMASEIFDPLGLIVPVLTIAKHFIQQLWKLKSNWDDVIDHSLFKQWECYYKKLPSLNTLHIPRFVLIDSYISIELHGFADSSMTAYGAVIYLRSADNKGNVSTRLLCAKSRIARKETIPRLELNAAFLLSNLQNKVKNALKINFSQTYLWVDSNIVLAWIHSTEPNKLKPYVKNRVIEINKNSDKESWHWVPSKDNPADLISRGVTADKLLDSTLWWAGPNWLSKQKGEWPIQKPKSLNLPNTNLELNEQVLCNTVLPTSDFFNELYNKWSNLSKLVRVFAYVRRFIKNLKDVNKIKSCLTTNELNDSLHTLIKFAQSNSFYNEYKLLKNEKPLHQTSNILCLNPFMKDEVMRVGGRLELSPYTYNKKHPILLHHKHTLTQLIVRAEHIKQLHAGPQLLLASVRERFWPTHGKSLANKIVHECVTCFKARPKTSNPIMGSLPASRTTPSPPFLTTTVDYCGAFNVRSWRGRSYIVSKCYISIFVCYSTKAVHIELVSSLESQAFLAALRRFIYRRGKPQKLVSDNATTFHGAKNELNELSIFLKDQSNEIMTHCANDGIEWSFLPAYTPHMGGLHEAAVKSCKYHLKRILSNALLTYEEFLTVLVQIEGILNSRPLCPLQSKNFDDMSVLTPAHFLIGRPIISLPDNDYKDIPINRLTHYQQLQQMQQDFWRCWSKDYVGNLQQRVRWRSSKGAGLLPGTMVLVKDDRLPPCQWLLGRIHTSHSGADGVTRVATIKTTKGLIRRAFNNICPLPIC